MLNFINPSLFSFRAHAQVITAELDRVGGILEIVKVIGMALNVLVFISGAVFIAYLIFGAYKFLTAQGDPKGIAGAKQSLTHSVIGLCIVIGVFAINAIVVGILGVDSSYSEVGGPSSGLIGQITLGIQEILDWIDL